MDPEAGYLLDEVPCRHIRKPNKRKDSGENVVSYFWLAGELVGISEECLEYRFFRSEAA